MLALVLAYHRPHSQIPDIARLTTDNGDDCAIVIMFAYVLTSNTAVERTERRLLDTGIYLLGSKRKILTKFFKHLKVRANYLFERKSLSQEDSENTNNPAKSPGHQTYPHNLANLLSFG